MKLGVGVVPATVLELALVIDYSQQQPECGHPVWGD